MSQFRRINSKECCVILGTYINAYTIAKCLQRMEYPYPILLMDTQVEKSKCLADVLLRHVIVYKKKLTNVELIVDEINNLVDSNTVKHVFMTCEEYIDIIKQAVRDGRLQNTTAQTGSDIDNDLIFDRYRFYEFIGQLNVIDVPKTIASTGDPFAVFGNQFVLRMKKSWQGAEKLPTLQIVHSREELEVLEAQYTAQNLTKDQWCYQELLSTLDTHNVSVCGWFDQNVQQLAVTRKVRQHPPKTGNGDVIEIFTEAPALLVQATEKILRAMRYEGPFELEYVYNQTTGKYVVIELNPRFWMQHGLIENLTDNFLIRRALGESKLIPTPYHQLPHRYWINGNQALYRIAKGQWDMFGFMAKGESYPSLIESAFWAFYYRKYMKELDENDG